MHWLSTPGGLTPEDAKQIAPHLVSAGIDVLDLSGGICVTFKQTGSGFFLYLADAIKPTVNIPVLVTGGLVDPQVAYEVIIRNRADLVGVGRALLADPEWAVKAKKF